MAEKVPHIRCFPLVNTASKVLLNEKDVIANQIQWGSVKQNSDGTWAQDVATVEDAGFKANDLTLQIGDTADEFNQLKVSIKDMHAAALGIGDLDISSQAGAQAALTQIKDAINQVSDLRGTLGATQNRLEHTISNLSVMQENIQDAESSIRDTDVASMMMEYTKNNIKVQAAQAMLAQANMLPQSLLQLLG